MAIQTVEEMKEKDLRELLAERDRRYTESFAHVAENLSAGLALLQTQIDAAKSATDHALASAERAVAKAETATEKRFESVNEFRGTLADAQRVLMPRSEAGVEFKALAEKIERLTTHDDLQKGRGEGVSALWAALVGVAGIVIAVLALILTATNRAKSSFVYSPPPQYEQQTNKDAAQ